MAYPSPTELNMSQGLGVMLSYVNAVTNSWVSYMLLISVYVIFLIGFYKAKDDFQGGLAIAGYGTFVMALFFWIGGFISGWAFGISIALAVIGTLVLLLDGD